jgi:hypothetical protein
MVCPARDLPNQNVERACLWQLEILNTLEALLKLLVIEAQLSITIIAPHEDLSEVKGDGGAPSVGLGPVVSSCLNRTI